MNILITGGAGFIGSNLARLHLEKGDMVWALDNLQSGRKENISPFLQNPNFTFDECDFISWPKLQEALNWADRVYHLAAVIGQHLVIKEPIKTLTDNIYGCQLLLEKLCKTSKKAPILIASSSGVYGHNHKKSIDFLKEDELLEVESGKYIQTNYYLSKIVNENTALSFSDKKGIKCVIARIFNTVGINQTSRYGMVIPTFVKQALRNEPITVFGDGTQTRSFCNVKDTIKAFDLLFNNPKSFGEIINVGHNEETSINELAYLVKKLTKSDSEITFVDYKTAYGIDFLETYGRKPYLEKLKNLTDFYPQTTLEESINEIIDFEKNKSKQT
jgi:UDP-glucose 4-epimerase